MDGSRAHFIDSGNARAVISSLALMLLTFGVCGCVSAQPAEGWDQVGEILARIKAPIFPDGDFPIAEYGAVADGATDCTGAIAKAVEACHAAGGGRVVVPAGEFHTGPIHLRSNVNLHVSEGATLLFSTDPADYLPVVFTRWEGVECMNYSPLIYAFEQENVAVTGKGTLDGQADNEHWWPWKGRENFGYKQGDPNQLEPRLKMFQMAEDGVPPEQRIMGDGGYLRPSFIEPYRCRNVLIEGVTIKRSPFWEIHPTLCENVTVRGVTVISHGPNNDGCDPESCKDVLIEDCLFDTGDDCIALKSGRNADGRRVNVPVENVVVRNCVMKDGHGGVVIGSEISGGARNVFAENCKMDSPNLDRVLRLKTNSVRGGLIENVYVRNIEVGQVADTILLVDFYYEEGDSGEFTPMVRNIRMENIHSRKSRYGFFAKGYDRSKIQDIHLKNMTLSNVDRGNVLENIDGLHVENVTINGEPFEPNKPAEAGGEMSRNVRPLGFQTDFEHNSAAGWTPTHGQWSVEEEDGNKVYAAAGGEECRARAGDQGWTDYRVQARIKPVELPAGDRIYLCGRYKDGNNYYSVSLLGREGGNRIELRKKFNKSSVTVKRKEFPIAPGEWYLVALETIGTTINVYVNGELQLTAEDSDLASGGIGLIANASKAYYDDIEVLAVDKL
jgi:polygalacturonase